MLARELHVGLVSAVDYDNLVAHVVDGVDQGEVDKLWLADVNPRYVEDAEKILRVGKLDEEIRPLKIESR
jgi:hypothetical protein